MQLRIQFSTCYKYFTDKQRVSGLQWACQWEALLDPARSNNNVYCIAAKFSDLISKSSCMMKHLMNSRHTVRKGEEVE